MRIYTPLTCGVLAIVLVTGCGGGNIAVGADWANPRLPKPVGVRVAIMSAKVIAAMIATRWALPSAPKPSIGRPIEFDFISRSALVDNPGMPTGFTVFLTTRRTIVIQPTSAATVQITNTAAPQFATPEDRRLWIAEHRPQLGSARTKGEQLAIPVGQYSFLLQGSTLTYREAAALPGNPGGLLTVLIRHLRPEYGSHPPTGVLLNQLASLLATAALTNSARSAAWQAVASLPGLRICHPRTAAGGSSSIKSWYASLCVTSAREQVIVAVDASLGTIRAVAERILRPSPLFPHVPAGAVVDINTYTVGNM